MANLFNVSCMLCGRAAGQVREGSFVRLTGAPPLRSRGGRAACGYCSGSLYLEAEASPLNRNLEGFSAAASSRQRRQVPARGASRASSSRASAARAS